MCISLWHLDIPVTHHMQWSSSRSFISGVRAEFEWNTGVAGISGSIYAIYNKVITVFQQYFDGFIFGEGTKPWMKNGRTGLNLYHNNDKILSVNASIAEYVHGTWVGILVGNWELSKQKELSPSLDLSTARAELIRLAYPWFGTGTTVVGIICLVSGVLDSRGCWQIGKM